MPLFVKRAYEPRSAQDGLRVLVDRLWPRGLSKDAAGIDLWLRDIAPSNELRRWFHQHPSEWVQFRKRYLEELGAPGAAAALEQLYAAIRRKKKLTLVFAARDSEHNNAVVLKEFLEGMRKPPTSSGPARTSAGTRARQSRAK